VRELVPAETGDVTDLEDRYAPPDTRHLRMDFVQSLDGAIAVDGRSKGLQTPADLRVFRTLRNVSDAVLVGAGTARQENYGPVRITAEGQAWRARTGRRPEVPLVVVSASGGTGLDAGRLAPDTLVLTCRAGANASVPFEQLVHGDDTVDLAAGLAALADRGLSRLVCEGGPTLFASLLARGLVDELCLTLSPLLVGPAPHLLAAAPDPPPALQLLSLLREDDVLLSRWAVRPTG
jgi:5-amino-6-(5-phosphoribosylamino)uracil reductase